MWSKDGDWHGSPQLSYQMCEDAHNTTMETYRFQETRNFLSGEEMALEDQQPLSNTDECLLLMSSADAWEARPGYMETSFRVKFCVSSTLVNWLEIEPER